MKGLVFKDLLLMKKMKQSSCKKKIPKSNY